MGIANYTPDPDPVLWELQITRLTLILWFGLLSSRALWIKPCTLESIETPKGLYDWLSEIIERRSQ